MLPITSFQFPILRLTHYITWDGRFTILNFQASWRVNNRNALPLFSLMMTQLAVRIAWQNSGQVINALEG